MTAELLLHPAVAPHLRRHRAAVTLLSSMAQDYARVGDQATSRQASECATRKARELAEYQASLGGLRIPEMPA